MQDLQEVPPREQAQQVSLELSTVDFDAVVAQTLYLQWLARALPSSGLVLLDLFEDFGSYVFY